MCNVVWVRVSCLPAPAAWLIDKTSGKISYYVTDHIHQRVTNAEF
jgi:hypothetical protein